jgi:hypothetical protein
VSSLRHLVAWLVRSDGARISALVGGLAGLWFSQVVWGGLDWLSAPYWSGTGFPDAGDVHAGLGAEQHFIHAPWTLPLFSLQTIAPEGVPLSLLATDAIALTALIGKLLASVGIVANVYAAWFLVVPVLQGAAAGILAWALGAGGRLRPLAAALLALAYGNWLQKSAIHPINAGHFTLLLALAIGAAIITGRIGPRRGVVLAALLVPLALLQTPYLAAMTIMIGAGSLIAALRAGLSRRSALIAIGSLVAFLAVALPLGGWMSFAADWSGGGTRDYGRVGANLFALFWPTRFPLAQGLGLDPFRLPVPSGQDVDSEVFIGIAALALVVIAILRSGPRELIGGLRRFWPLALGPFAAWLFALTNNLGVGPLQLRLFELPDPIAPFFHAFRWSARFTWPAAYLLMIGALVVVSRPIVRGSPGAPRRLVPGLLALLMSLGGLAQALDYGDIGAIRMITTRYPEDYAERAFADRSLEGAAGLALYPAHSCFSDIGLSDAFYNADRLMRDQHTYWMTATGRRGIPTTAAKLNRGADARCHGADGYGGLIASALKRPGVTLVLHGRLARALGDRAGLLGSRCAAVPGMTVCAPRPLIADPWVRTAGVGLSSDGLPLIERSVSADEVRMGALLAWADGFARDTGELALLSVWKPKEDPRIAQARLPIIAGAGNAALSVAWGVGNGSSVALVVRATDGAMVRIDGAERAMRAGETVEIAGAPPRCDRVSCSSTASFAIIEGTVELVAVELR